LSIEEVVEKIINLYQQVNSNPWIL
jgi:uncharacterized protein YlzI (FlbEa/FlbD family)